MKPQNITQGFFGVNINIRREIHPTFAFTDGLAQSSAKGIKDIPYRWAINMVRFRKKHQVISEEKVGETNPTVGAFNRSLASFTAFFFNDMSEDFHTEDEKIE